MALPFQDSGQFQSDFKRISRKLLGMWFDMEEFKVCSCNLSNLCRILIHRDRTTYSRHYFCLQGSGGRSGVKKMRIPSWMSLDEIIGVLSASAVDL